MPALQGGRRTLCEAAVDLLHPRAVSALQPVAVTIRELSEPPPFAHRGRPVSDPLLQTDLPVPDNHIGILFFDFVGDGDSNGERETTGEGERGSSYPHRGCACIVGHFRRHFFFPARLVNSPFRFVS